MAMLTCYHKGCGKEYVETDNTDTACQYHPGMPVFHEGLKGWSCCKKRVTDFSDFLSMPGCTQGSHTNEKPSEPANPQPEPVREAVPQPITMQKQTAPLSTEAVKVALKQTQQAQSHLEARKKEWSEQAAMASSDTVAPDTLCLNKGCGKTYGEAGSTPCTYHAGVPVFHEGMKYWSCCERKTTDFQRFLEQTGCTTGNHKWKESAKDGAVQTNCRYDFFQSASTLTVNIYAASVDPDQSSCSVSEGKLSARLCFDNDKVFDLSFALHERVQPHKCTATVHPSKVELTLVKASNQMWPRLEG